MTPDDKSEVRNGMLGGLVVATVVFVSCWFTGGCSGGTQRVEGEVKLKLPANIATGDDITRLRSEIGELLKNPQQVEPCEKITAALVKVEKAISAVEAKLHTHKPCGGKK